MLTGLTHANAQAGEEEGEWAMDSILRHCGDEDGEEIEGAMIGWAPFPLYPILKYVPAVQQDAMPTTTSVLFSPLWLAVECASASQLTLATERGSGRELLLPLGLIWIQIRHFTG